MNNQELTQEETKRNYIREMAEDDFECGHPFDPDDFNEFKKIMKGDTGLEASHEDFKLYFDLFDEIREEAYREHTYDFE